MVLKRIAVFSLLSLVALVGKVEAKSASSKAFEERIPTIKVLLENEQPGATLEVSGSYTIFNPANNKRLESSLLSKGRSIQPVADGLRWGSVYPDIFQIKIVPDSKLETISVNGIQYKGSIYVYNIGGRISIVNEVELEDYVKSVLGGEFEAPLHKEAMEAIAIAIRTDAYAHVMYRKDNFWHVDKSKVNYQGYGVTHRNNGVDHAVDATHHLMLYPQGNETIPFPTPITKHCAGKTAAYNAIFKSGIESPQRRGVDSYLAQQDRENTAWQWEVKQNKIADLFNWDKVTSISLFQDTDSKKVYGMRLEGELRGERVHHDSLFLDFQNRVGKDTLKSNDFTIMVKEGYFVFKGYGEGHGVGLCVYSAAKMAEKGSSSENILTTFFPDTHILMVSQIK